MKERFIADLTHRELNVIKGPDGKSWTYPSMYDRNTLQIVAYQRHADAILEVMEAAKREAPSEEIAELAEFSEALKVKLAVALLTSKDAPHLAPTEEEAEALARAGVATRITASDAEIRAAEAEAETKLQEAAVGKAAPARKRKPATRKTKTRT